VVGGDRWVIVDTGTAIIGAGIMATELVHEQGTEPDIGPANGRTYTTGRRTAHAMLRVPNRPLGSGPTSRPTAPTTSTPTAAAMSTAGPTTAAGSNAAAMDGRPIARPILPTGRS